MGFGNLAGGVYQLGGRLQGAIDRERTMYDRGQQSFQNQFGVQRYNDSLDEAARQWAWTQQTYQDGMDWRDKEFSTGQEWRNKDFDYRTGRDAVSDKYRSIDDARQAFYQQNQLDLQRSAQRQAMERHGWDRQEHISGMAYKNAQLEEMRRNNDLDFISALQRGGRGQQRQLTPDQALKSEKLQGELRDTAVEVGRLKAALSRHPGEGTDPELKAQFDAKRRALESLQRQITAFSGIDEGELSGMAYGEADQALRGDLDLNGGVPAEDTGWRGRMRNTADLLANAIPYVNVAKWTGLIGPFNAPEREADAIAAELGPEMAALDMKIQMQGGRATKEDMIRERVLVEKKRSRMFGSSSNQSVLSLIPSWASRDPLLRNIPSGRRVDQ